MPFDAAKHNRERRARLESLGLCIGCGRAKEWQCYLMCNKCRAKQLEYQKASMKRRKAAKGN